MDRSELEAKVAEGQRAQAALAELQALDTMTDEIEEIKTAISDLEAEERFVEAGPLKTKLAKMASARGR